MHARLLWSTIGFAGITRNAGAYDVLPGGGSAAFSWNHMIQIEVLAVKNTTTVLAGVFVPLKNIVTRKLHFFLGEPIKKQQQNHPGNPYFKRDRVNGFWMWFGIGKVAPLLKIVGLK